MGRAGRRSTPVGAALLVIAALSLVNLTASGWAQIATLPTPAAPPSSIQVAVAQLAEALTKEPASGTSVLTFHVDAQWKDAPRGSTVSRLENHVGQSFAAALTARDGRFREGAVGTRFHVVLRVEGSQFTAEASRVRMPITLWEHFRQPNGQVVATAFTSVPVDVEIRTLARLPSRRVRLDSWNIKPAGIRSHQRLRSERVLDMAFVDMDGDRQSELLVLQRDALLVLAWNGTGFGELIASTTLDALPPNPQRLREPMGRLALVVMADGSRAVMAASSDSDQGVFVRLAGASLDVVKAPTGHWPAYGLDREEVVTLPWPRGTDVLQGGLSVLNVSTGVVRSAGCAMADIYDVRSFGARTTASEGWNPHLLVVRLGGRLVLRDASEVQVDVGNRGIATLVRDLDEDGAPEVVTTSPGITGGDLIRVERLLGGRLKAAWSVEVAAPVTAICAGDVDLDGQDEIVAATWNSTLSLTDVLVAQARKGR